MAIGGVQSVGSQAAATQSLGSNLNLSSSQFLQLFLAQLQNQDPSSPVDASTMTSQLAQLTTVQSIQGLTASFDQMLQLQQLTQGNDLIGRTVKYTAANGATQSGVVNSVSVQNGNISLNVGATSVPLSSVVGITQTPAI
jgi:flagellar basal-body rod modification protein FlgD